MDRILLTGATGVIGRRLLPLLVSSGYPVTAVGRTPEQRGLLHAVGANPISLDLLQPVAVRAAIEGHDVVINLATHMPPSMFRMLFRLSNAKLRAASRWTPRWRSVAKDFPRPPASWGSGCRRLPRGMRSARPGEPVARTHPR